MPIDTAPKRLSAIATRRLPWMRRFALPAADGAITQADRQQVALVYRGVLAGQSEELTGPFCAHVTISFPYAATVAMSFPYTAEATIEVC